MLKLQAFGPKEKNFSEEDKEKIIEILKYSNYASLPIRRMVFDAERYDIVQPSQTAHYFELAKLAGLAVTAGVYTWMPVIRRQPIARRAFFAAVPGYLIYKWTTNYGENLRWTKSRQRL